MGNIVGSFISGFVKVVGDLFGAPLDFLSGKSCRSVCGSTWDLICYIENFCIADLLKLLAVLVLLYIVLLFFYLLYKVGICHCIGKNMYKMLWSCFSSCLSACEHGCMFLWFKLRNIERIDRKRKRELERDLEDYSSSSGDDEFESDSHPHRPTTIEFRRSRSHQRSRERRRIHLERSLRPRSHRRRIHLERSLRPRSRRIRVGISRGSVYMNDDDRRPRHRHTSSIHNIKVTHTSKFVQKGNISRSHRKRW